MKTYEDKICVECGELFEVASATGNVKKFCNSSCSAAYNNKQRGRKQRGRKELTCPGCEKLFHPRAAETTFCSISCSWDWRRKTNDAKILAEPDILGEVYRDHATQKLFLLRVGLHECSVCGITEWQGQPVPLVMDHVDGNSENDKMSNLRLVCGNCDMQLPTYKSKNKGKGRASRRKRYAEGKSY